MKILEGKEKEYKDWYDKNNDPYRRACFVCAERWAGMLETKTEAIQSQKRVEELYAEALNAMHSYSGKGGKALLDLCMVVL